MLWKKLLLAGTQSSVTGVLVILIACPCAWSADSAKKFYKEAQSCRVP